MPARAVPLLAQLDGLTYKEVAARLGVSLSSVEKYMAAAFAHCYRIVYLMPRHERVPERAIAGGGAEGHRMAGASSGGSASAAVWDECRLWREAAPEHALAWERLQGIQSRFAAMPAVPAALAQQTLNGASKHMGGARPWS